jgi:chromosome segregation ATPase
MNKFILLLVLVSGLLAGYMVGDYRGKDARAALNKAIETGNTLGAERETAITNLKTELNGINEKHQRELDAVRKANDIRKTEWQCAKESLDASNKRLNAQLADSDNQIKSLVAKRDAASGAEKASLDQEIARQQNTLADLRREIQGNTCLQTQLPNSVFNAMNEAKTAGRK